MNILWQSVAPWCPTGYGVQTAGITRVLHDLGHNVVISAYYGLMTGGFLRWRGIPVWPADDKKWGAGHTKQYYDKFESDICITLQDIWTLPDRYGMNFNWYPYMPVDHDPIPPIVVSRLPFAVKPIAYAKFGAEQLRSKGIDCYYAPHGIDTEVYKPQTKWRMEFPDADFVVGCVAVNRGGRKNLDGLIQAFAVFHQTHPKSVLYIHTKTAGYNLGDVQLGSLAKEMGVEPDVFFPNPKDYDAGFTDKWMSIMYNSLDVFCLPSRGEGFGIPIIEAQACGTPVIVTNITSMPELLGGGWLLKDLGRRYDYQSSWQAEPKLEEIVACLEAAYQAKKDGSILEMMKKAREKSLQYDWSRVKKYWERILADIESKPKAKNREGIQEPRLLLIPKDIELKKVLDIGCGLTAPYKPYLQGLGEYVGIDSKSGNGAVKADATNLPFLNKEFGFVWCSEVLEHLHPGGAQKAVDEARRVGVHGAIMFPTPKNDNFALDPGHNEVKLKEDFPIDAYGNGVIIW